MSKHTVQSLASLLYSAFEQRTRPSGEKFWTLKDGSPEWMKDLCLEAHGGAYDMLPDDWRYQFIWEAAGVIEDADDTDDLPEPEPDVYNGELMAWASSHGLRYGGYCDDALDQLGAAARSLIDIVRYAQELEMREVRDSVLASLESRWHDVEDGYNVAVWEERDRLQIRLLDVDENDVASWSDDDAREMFEAGFFERGNLEQSVIDYARSIDLI